MNTLIKLSNKRIDLAGFRFRRQPLFDYSLFDPVSENEWLKLEKALDIKEVRRAFSKQRNVVCTYQAGQTNKGEPVLCTYHHDGCFAGVCWTPATADLYLAHVSGRVGSRGGAPIIEVSSEGAILFYDLKQPQAHPHGRN